MRSVSAGSAPRAAPAGDLQWLDSERRLLWAADLRECLRTADGYARDNVAWGGAWDIDVSAVRCPVRLYYGGQDRLVPAGHGRWLAERIAGAVLKVQPGAGHGVTSFGDWDAILGPLREALS
jgi:pimeloyl-ACP methyl ester carboxylesterase